MDIMNKSLSTVAVILGILFVLVAIYYWITPAGSLPGFMPGHIAGSMVVHVKHGIAALLLGIALFIYAWFSCGKKNA